MQAQAFRDCTNEFVAQINDRLAWCEANTPDAFFAEFEEDFRKIERATLALQDNVTSLQSGSIDSVDSLVEHRVLSRDDVDLVGKFSESLEETPDVLETKYPPTFWLWMITLRTRNICAASSSPPSTVF